MKTKGECEQWMAAGVKCLEEGRAWSSAVEAHAARCVECSAKLAKYDERLRELGNVLGRDHGLEPAASFRSAVMARVREEERRRREMRERWSLDRAQEEFEALMKREGLGMRRNLTWGGVCVLVGVLVLFMGLNGGAPLVWVHLLQEFAEWCGRSVLNVAGVSLGVAFVLAWGGKWVGEGLADRVGTRMGST